MNPLITLSTLLNFAIARRLCSITVPNSKVVRLVLDTLYYNSLILGYTPLSSKITVTLRYANGQPPFKALVLASKGSRKVYLEKGFTLSSPVLLSSSTEGVTLHRRRTTSGGKALFFLMC